MGYHLSVKAKSTGARTRMLAFMEANYKPWGNTAGPVEPRGTDKLVIEYSSCLHGLERIFVYCIIRWMALQVGKLRGHYNKDVVFPNKFNPPVPYMTYDGYEHWPILVCDKEPKAMSLPTTARWCATDKYGIYLSERTSESLLHAAMDAHIGRPSYDRLRKEVIEKIGHCPQEEKAKIKWLNAHKRIMTKHCQPEIHRMLRKVRKEIARLDQLWKETA